MQDHPSPGKDLRENLLPVNENWSQKSCPERNVASLMARAKRERVVESVVKKANRTGPARPGPARPDPARPPPDGGFCDPYRIFLRFE